jgi:hypothetical protein
MMLAPISSGSDSLNGRIHSPGLKIIECIGSGNSSPVALIATNLSPRPDSHPDTTHGGLSLGEKPMTPQPETAPNSDRTHLRITAEGVEVRCDIHPDFTGWLALDSDRRVPGSWLTVTLGSHIADHHGRARHRPEPEERQEIWLPATTPLAVA